MPCDRQNTQAIIYIPLRIYFNQVRVSITISFNDIYISLCIYFNWQSQTCLIMQTKYLHSTMYLFQLHMVFLFCIDIFIYIPLCIYFNLMFCHAFLFLKSYLHSTMYLFQHSYCNGYISRNDIYIPLCIYFNCDNSTILSGALLFTFHYVSISTTKIAATNGDKKAFTFHYVSISTIR